MKKSEFEVLVAEEFGVAIPLKFRNKISNLAFRVQIKPSKRILFENGLSKNETLLGLYQGVPAIFRGDHYGVGPVLPDVITIFMEPIIFASDGSLDGIRKIIKDTIWHEVAHHFGFSEEEIEKRQNQV